MKKVKKLMALLLSMIMVLAMSVTAFAATPSSGNLTVNLQNGSLKNQKIYLFKLFDYESVDPVKYTVNDSYKTQLQTVLKISSTDSYELYSAITALGRDNDQNVQTFANNFTKQIIANGNITGNEDKDYQIAKVTENVKSHTFNNVAPGYYLVYLGGSETIQSSLVTVDGNKEVELKSTTPTPDKQAFDSTGNTEVKNVQVGDVLTYKVTAKVPDISAYNANTYVFKLKDTLSAGLDFVADANGTAVNNNKMNVSVSVNKGQAQTLQADINERNMTLDLAQVVKDNQKDNIGRDIVVTYYAQVNEDAVIDNTSNSATLEYSNAPGTGGTGESLPNVVKTPTFAINVHKFEQGKNTEYLAGAEFQLHKAQENGEIDNDAIIKMVDKGNGKYVVAKNQSSPTAVDKVVTVGSKLNGGNYNLQINGLAAGTYYLVETKAPEGFNKIADPIKLVVKDTTNDGTTPSYSITVDADEHPTANNIVAVANSRGTILPGTGGMGTVIFTVAGIVLILGVGASFVISRKRKAE